MFSETHIRETGTLYTSVPQTDHLLPERHTRLAQDVGALDRYAGFGSHSRSYTTGHVVMLDRGSEPRRSPRTGGKESVRGRASAVEEEKSAVEGGSTADQV